MYILIKLITIFFNMGVASGFLVGALLLLRPALVRALSPRQRLWLWFLAWGAGYLPVWYNVLTLPRILPVTLLDLITPRTMADESIPAYLPVFQGGGQYNLAFPGGASVTVSLEWWMAALFCLVWAAGVILMFRRFGRQSSRLKKTALQGRLLDWDGPELGRLQIPRPEDAPIQVRLCRDLPTSFICSDWESRDGESISTIYLQEELPPERMALVLRHELNHRVRIHGMVKAAVTFALALHWWNPLLWLAHRYVCLDLELDCDQATLNQLPPAQRREYAKTLVELGAGRQLWDVPLAFGESDGAVRVKALLAWRPRSIPFRVLQWAAFVLVLLFFLGGPWRAVLPRDVELDLEENFGSTAAFVQQDQQLQHERGTFPEDVTIQEGWRRIAENGTVYQTYRLSDGRWGECTWLRIGGHPWYCADWSWTSGPPDQAQYQFCYPAA